MATKAEPAPTAGGKQGQTSYKQQSQPDPWLLLPCSHFQNSSSPGAHRRAHDKGPPTPNRNHEDSPRKKVTVVQSSPRNHGKAERGKGTAGGRDSSQQSARYENKHGSRARDPEQQHNSSRHGRPVHVQGEKPHNRRGHHHKHLAEPKSDSLTSRKGGGGGHRSHHHSSHKPAAKGEEEVEGETNPDSGISIEESSSPEVALQQEGDAVCEEATADTEAPWEGREEEVKDAGEEGEMSAEPPGEDPSDPVKITYTRVCSS